ncbi:MAG: ATP-binding protein [Bacteroidales bacterium]|nr:ATP-binding protein [Bacteroidales bacterium]MBD5258396.1 ATP-binding protein [Barnesiella sp.]
MSMIIPRAVAPHIEEAHKYYPVIVVTGPRQSGKTFMCRHIFEDYKYVNLEDITSRVAATADPGAFLESLGDRTIIDEVQNVPDLLSMIQVSVDNNPDKRYILTGSSNFALLQSITQSLAGRAATFTLLPFSLIEAHEAIEDKSIDSVMQSGLYPGLIAKGIPSEMFYRNYYNTYVERDLRNLLKIQNLLAFDTFIRLIASRAGSEFNASALAREAGVSSVTIKEWLSLLTASYIVFPLRPYFANISKQLTKMPKIYFYDTGLLCFLLGINSAEQLEKSPFRGAVFENLAICELIKREYNSGKDPLIYFYREKSGAEIDALVSRNGRLTLYEIKSSETLRPDFIQNMKATATLLPEVDTTTVIYNGTSIPPVAINIRDI